jgi:hypothetical protein
MLQEWDCWSPATRTICIRKIERRQRIYPKLGGKKVGARIEIISSSMHVTELISHPFVTTLMFLKFCFLDFPNKLKTDTYELSWQRRVR